jgi:hypothetical protein
MMIEQLILLVVALMVLGMIARPGRPRVRGHMPGPDRPPAARDVK